MKTANRTLLAGSAVLAFLLALGWYLGRPARSPDKGDNRLSSLPYVTAPGWSFPQPPSVYFLDNDRLIYLGASDEEYDELFAGHQFAVRVWNWRTGKAESIDRAVHLQLCYDGIHVRYIVEHSETIVERFGPINSLKEERFPSQRLRGQSLNERGEREHVFHCRIYKLADLGPEANCRILLRDGDGMLDATGRSCRETERKEQERLQTVPKDGSKSRTPLFEYEQKLLQRPAAYLSRADSEPIDLPIVAREISRFGGGIKFSQFAQAYVFRADHPVGYEWEGSWPTGLSIPVYILRRGGAVERRSVPYDDRVGGAPVDVQLARRGLVLLSTNVRMLPDPGDAGVYLLEGTDKPRRVFKAIVREVAVSPDGCRLAVNSHFYPKESRQVRGRLHVVDLCEGTGK